MKVAVFVLFTCFVVSSLAYDDTDNKIDYAKISKEEINQNLDCFMDRGPCSDIQNHYKGHIIDTVKTKCAQCTPFHKHNGHMFFQALEKYNPKGLEEFRAKFAPEPGTLEQLESDIAAF